MSISEQIAGFEDITIDVSRTFGHLNEDQLNWKPDPGKWSIAQCLDHLIASNSLYFKFFRKISEGKYHAGFWRSHSPFSNLFGKMLIRAMKSGKSTFRAPVSFKPRYSRISGSILSEFISHNEQFIQLIRRLPQENLDKIKIYSPVSKLITYSLSDCLEILLHHEKRHLNQAMRVLSHSDFPVNESSKVK